MAETLVKLFERIVEICLKRVWGSSAEAWDFFQFKLLCIVEGSRESCKRTGDAVLVAAVQIDVEHGTIVAQKDLEVDLQAGMRLHHGLSLIHI